MPVHDWTLVDAESMPVFLEPDSYIAAPLETTYCNAFEGVPEFWREQLER